MKHGCHSYLSTVDCRCLAHFDPQKYLLKLNLALFFTFRAETTMCNNLILYFFAHEKRKKKTLLNKIAEIGKKRPVCSLWQLKTHIAFSKFPTLGKNLWLRCQYVTGFFLMNLITFDYVAFLSLLKIVFTPRVGNE